jgi:hypothetical protein
MLQQKGNPGPIGRSSSYQEAVCVAAGSLPLRRGQGFGSGLATSKPAVWDGPRRASKLPLKPGIKLRRNLRSKPGSNLGPNLYPKPLPKPGLNPGRNRGPKRTSNPYRNPGSMRSRNPGSKRGPKPGNRRTSKLRSKLGPKLWDKQGDMYPRCGGLRRATCLNGP